MASSLLGPASTMLTTPPAAGQTHATRTHDTESRPRRFPVADVWIFSLFLSSRPSSSTPDTSLLFGRGVGGSLARH